ATKNPPKERTLYSPVSPLSALDGRGGGILTFFPSVRRAHASVLTSPTWIDTRGRKPKTSWAFVTSARLWRVSAGFGAAEVGAGSRSGRGAVGVKRPQDRPRVPRASV